MIEQKKKRNGNENKWVDAGYITSGMPFKIP